MWSKLCEHGNNLLAALAFVSLCISAYLRRKMNNGIGGLLVYILITFTLLRKIKNKVIPPELHTCTAVPCHYWLSHCSFLAAILIGISGILIPTYLSYADSVLGRFKHTTSIFTQEVCVRSMLMHRWRQCRNYNKATAKGIWWLLFDSFLLYNLW